MMVGSDQETFLTSGADAIIAKHPIPKDLQNVTRTVIEKADERVVEITEEEEGPNPSLLPAGLKASNVTRPDNSQSVKQAWSHPLKAVNTKHAGQQGLDIRSDGRIFATAGWDSKARVYSCKTLKELAVLEWHKVGCYAVAFPDMKVLDESDRSSTPSEGTSPRTPNRAIAAITQSRSLVKDRRIRQATTTHWLAVGAKDGKISLWDIY